jgi:hypothetical protein
MKSKYLFLLLPLVALIPACPVADPGTPKPKFAFGVVQNPVLPTIWGASNFYIDPANVTTTATDSGNLCTSNATPCLTWHHLNDQVWGCQGSPSGCPRFRQSVTIQQDSNHTDNSDPVYFQPTIENQAVVSYVCPLGASQQLATATLNVVTAKNRATPQLLATTFTGFTGTALAANQFMVNATHPSSAWVYTAAGGIMSQPLVRPALPLATAAPAEVDTWANADAITTYAPVQANIVALLPTLVDYNGAQNNGLQVQNCNVYDPAGGGNPLRINGSVRFAETLITRNVQLATIGNSTTSVFANTDFQFSAYGGELSNALRVSVFGGLSRAKLALMNMQIDDDTIIGATTGAAINTQSYMYVDTGVTLSAYPSNGTSVVVSNVTWGPGTYNAVGRINYPSGAGAAATAFKITTLAINGQSKACADIPGAATAFGTCNLSMTAAQADTTLGATTGCLSPGNGGAFCNYGP